MAAWPIDLKTLSRAERLELVQDVWDNIADESAEALDGPEWQREELRQRLPAHDAAPEAAVPCDLVRRALFRVQSQVERLRSCKRRC